MSFYNKHITKIYYNGVTTWEIKGDTEHLGVKWIYVLKIIMKDSIDSNDDNYLKLNEKYCVCHILISGKTWNPTQGVL